MKNIDVVYSIDKAYKVGLAKAVYKDFKCFANLSKNTLYRLYFLPNNSFNHFGDHNFLEFDNGDFCFEVNSFNEALEFINLLTDNHIDNLERVTKLFNSELRSNVNSVSKFYIKVELFQGIQ